MIFLLLFFTRFWHKFYPKTPNYHLEKNKLNSTKSIFSKVTTNLFKNNDRLVQNYKKKHQKRIYCMNINI